MSRPAWLKVAGTAMLLAAIMPQYLLPSLVVEMRHDFAVSDTQLGLASAAGFAFAAISSVTVGSHLARRDARLGVAAAAILLSASCLGMAVLAGSSAAVVGLMIFGGVGAGIVSPSLYELVATGTRGAGQGMALGLLSAAPQMSAFVAGLALPLIALPLNWQLAYVISAIFTLITAVLIWQVSAPRSEDLAGSRVATGHLLRSPLLIRVGVAASLVSAGGLGLRAFLVLAAIDSGLSPSAGAALFSLAALITIISRVMIGASADHSDRDPWGQSSMLMMLAAAGLLIMVIGSPIAVVIGTIIAGGFGWSWQAPLNLALARHYPDAAGVAIASVLTGFYVGGVIGPLAVGWLVHSAGFQAAWIACAALSAGGAVCVQFAGRAAR